MAKSRNFSKQGSAKQASADVPEFKEIGPGAVGPVYTGRKIVVHRDVQEFEVGLRRVADSTGLKTVAVSSDFGDAGIDLEEASAADGIHFERLGISIYSGEPERLQRLAGLAGEAEEEIVAVVPERFIYLAGAFPSADGPGFMGANSLEYLRGFQEGLAFALQRLGAGEALQTAGDLRRPAFSYSDTDGSTWGLQAVGVLDPRGKPLTKWTGKGVRVAVIDSGIDLDHPHFRDKIAGKKAVAPQDRGSVQDTNGHGTHVAGTIAGRKGYGVAPDAELYIAKVFPGGGRETEETMVLAGIDWAIVNKCQIANLSLAGPAVAGQDASVEYRRIGERSLREGTLLIAAAGNDSNRPQIRPVGEPANAPSIIGVSAIDAAGEMYTRSNGRVGNTDGGEIDFTGPGVNVFSAWPVRLSSIGSNRLDGTSMAAPHVAGIAALHSESKGGIGGQALWDVLAVSATRKDLSHGGRDIGHGLVQAP